MAEPRQVKCPLCETPGVQSVADFTRDIYHIRCPVCGHFMITEEGADELGRKHLAARKHLLSSLTRQANSEKRVAELLSSTVADQIASVHEPTDPFEVLDKLLLDIHRRTTSLTGSADLPPEDYPLYALRSRDELGEFVHQLAALGLVELAGGKTVRLTLKGWQKIGELRTTSTKSRRAFVAMWFDLSLRDAYDNGIRPALEAAGWTPVRVDELEYNDRIDDRIIAEIRQAGLVVADFTGQRGGVYFEAGFGLGLGLPVILTVHKDEVAKVHFDTRQYNHIVWADAADLRERLEARVRATVPAPPAGGV